MDANVLKTSGQKIFKIKYYICHKGDTIVAMSKVNFILYWRGIDFVNCIFKVCLNFIFLIFLILAELKKHNKTKVSCIFCRNKINNEKTLLENLIF